LPNSQFEFGGASESGERTINQPWTQVVLEGLRRLDEGIVPAAAFPPDYYDECETNGNGSEDSLVDLESMRVPSFLSFMGSEPMSKRKFVIAGAVAFAVIASVAAIGVPAGWYRSARASTNPSQPTVTAATETTAPPAEVPKNDSVESSQPDEHSDETALAEKRQREKDREKARTREDKAALTQSTSGSTLVPTNVLNNEAKSGPKKVTVSVTYDESGRVTQASGGDASAVRIARQKRFPAGKAGSATITIPIN
jgi:hypothetical protein